MNQSDRERRALLGQGLDLLTHGLRLHVQEHLAIFRSAGPWRVFWTDWGDKILGDEDNDPELPETWDLHALLAVLQYTWPVLLEGQGHTRREVAAKQGWVAELQEVRNRWAHQRYFEPHDVQECLLKVGRMLEFIGRLEEAETARRASKDVPEGPSGRIRRRPEGAVPTTGPVPVPAPPEGVAAPLPPPAAAAAVAASVPAAVIPSAQSAAVAPAIQVAAPLAAAAVPAAPAPAGPAPPAFAPAAAMRPVVPAAYAPGPSPYAPAPSPYGTPAAGRPPIAKIPERPFKHHMEIPISLGGPLPSKPLAPAPPKATGGVPGASGWPKGPARDSLPENLRYLFETAEGGNPKSMFRLGRAFELGRDGAPVDEKEAVYWYRRAAEGGDAYGMFNFARMIAAGRGTAPDEEAALHWLRKSAEAGNAYAMFDLGKMYEGGRGAERDEVEAVAWYRKAAEAGNPYGMFKLGHMLENGAGIARDMERATHWYRKAAMENNEYAQNALMRLNIKWRSKDGW